MFYFLGLLPLKLLPIHLWMQWKLFSSICLWGTRNLKEWISRLSRARTDKLHVLLFLASAIKGIFWLLVHLLNVNGNFLLCCEHVLPIAKTDHQKIMHKNRKTSIGLFQNRFCGKRCLLLQNKIVVWDMNSLQIIYILLRRGSNVCKYNVGISLDVFNDLKSNTLRMKLSKQIKHMFSRNWCDCA